jgi:23S rRNA (guanosine2251-2'-O)-methyltransferase
MSKQELLVGKNPVLEALRAKRPLNRILIAPGGDQNSIREILAVAQERNIPIQYVEKKHLSRMAGGGNHQGVIAQVSPKEYVEWEKLLEIAAGKKEDPLLLLLDGIEDPHNLGAILRTAEAVGVHGVIIPKHRAVPLTWGVAKSSAGAIEYVPVAKVTNLAMTMEKLKEMGCWIVGTDPAAPQSYFEANLQGPLVVVMGGENKGMGKLVRSKCDFLVKIPMRGRINSLNVSVAASLVLYEIVRQRTQ